MSENIIKILRSLCANTPEELEMAQENFRGTELSALDFKGVHEKFLQEIRNCYFIGGPPTTDTIREKAMSLQETELSLFADEVKLAKFEWGSNYQTLLQMYLEDFGIEKLAEIMQETSQISRDGREVKGNVQRGLVEAIQHLLSGATELHKQVDPRQRAMANLEAVDFLYTQYLERRDRPTLAFGVSTGIRPLDDATKGGHDGELWIVGGFTSSGKTSFCLNWARYAAIEAGFNVLFFSLEMSKEQIWRILAAGHSAHPKFKGYQPLQYDKIKSGSLLPEEEDFYLNKVLPDLRNPLYGRIEVETPVGDTNIGDIRARAEALNRKHPLDMVIIDYIELVGADKRKRRNADRREMLNENIIAAKQMSLDFDQGRGVLVVSPHQISRNGWDLAKKNRGIYEVNALSEANQAERCLRKKELIPTTNGYRTIESLQRKELKVGSLSGQKTIESYYDSGFQKMLKIVNSKGREIIVSENTRLRVWEDKKLTWKKAVDLKERDILVSAMGYNLFGDEIPKLKVNELQNGHEKAYTLPIEMDEELAYLFGYMTGDGYVGDRGRYAIYISDTEMDLEPLLVDVFERRFSVKLREHHQSGCFCFGGDSYQIVRYFEENGLAGNCYTKVFPECLYSAKREIIISWLRGFFDAEGHISKKCIEIGVMNFGLINWVQELFLNLGIDSRWYINKRNKNRVGPTARPGEKDFPHLTVIGRESVEKLQELGIFRQKDKKEKLDAFVKREKSRGIYYEGTAPFLKDLLKFKSTSGAGLLRPFRNKLYHWKQDKREVSLSIQTARELSEVYPDLAQDLSIFSSGNLQFSRVVSVQQSGEADCADITVGGDYEYQGPGVLLHNSSDVVFAIYQDQPLRQKKEAVCTMLKNRDGAVIEPWNIYFSPTTRVMGGLDVGRPDMTLDDLLDA